MGRAAQAVTQSTSVKALADDIGVFVDEDGHYALTSQSSWPGLSRPSTPCRAELNEDVDARHKAGHDRAKSPTRFASRTDLPLSGGGNVVAPPSVNLVVIERSLS